MTRQCFSLSKPGLALLLAVLLAALTVGAMGAPARKVFDLRKLEEEWADEDDEDDGWHEDTYEWKEKERKRRQQAKLQDMMKGGKGVKGGKGGGMGGLGGWQAWRP